MRKVLRVLTVLLAALVVLPHLAVAQVVVSEPPEDGPPRWLRVAIGAAQAGDALSTQVALAREGTDEWNPLLRGDVRRVVVKASLTALSDWGVRELWRRGHRKAAIASGLFVAAAGTAATVHNLRVARRQCP